MLNPQPDPNGPFTVEHFDAWAYDLELDNGEPWVVEDYFNSFLEDYFAGIPECWLLVGEGNAKTTNFAGLGVYLLEFRPNASIPWAASSRDQAEIGYRQAAGFVQRSPRLQEFLKCQDGYRRIRRKDGTGRMQIFAADDGTGDGIIPTDAFIDELHRHKHLRLYRTWQGKLGKRAGQLATISTSGEPGAEFEDTRERIRQETPVVERRPGYIRCRTARIAFHEYAVPEGADVEDMATVKLANPFSGITAETLAAKFSSPTMTIPHWRRFVCNLATRSDASAITEAEWFGARAEQEIPLHTRVWGGLDVAWKWDTTALVPLWWKSDSERVLGRATVLEPPRDGSTLDVDAVKFAISEQHRLTPFHTMVMDTHAAEDIASWIESELGIAVIDWPQGNPAAADEYTRFMEALRNGWLKWTAVGNELLTQHALNAIAKTLPLGDRKFDRPSQSRAAALQDRRVIDALKAAAMVHAAANSRPVTEASVYETRGLATVGRR